MATGSTIGALRVVIGADTAGLKRGLGDAQKGLGDVRKSALPAVAAIAAVGAAAAAAGAKFISMARDEMNVIDSQAKLARSIGGTVNGLRSLKIAAEDNGIDGLESSLARLNRRLGAVEMGSGPAVNTVKQLGLNLKELASVDVDERLARIADALVASGVSAQEAARHLQNLGFQQQGVTELFLQGGDAIRASRDELQAFGLAVSQIDAERIEAANTAFARVGRVIEGIRTQMAVALTPVIVTIAEKLESVGRAVATITPYIAPVVEAFVSLSEQIAVAVAGVAAFYAPAVLAGIASFTTAVGVGAVGAVRALTAAIAANPIGAILTALVAVGYAVYKFRDQIQDAIGVDVTAIFKTAANTVMNSFVAAYEDIKFVWNNFGDMMGAAVIGGVNVAIRGINKLIEGALSGINSIIEATNKIPGVNIGKIGDGAKIDLLDNEYSGRLVSAVKERNAKIAAIMSTDRFAGAEGGMVITDTPSDVGVIPGGTGGAGGGGGGGAAAAESSDLQNRLDMLRDFLATREDLEVQSGIERVNLIGEALEAGLVTEQEHNKLLYDTAEKFYDAMAELREQKNKEKLDELKELNELGIIDDEEYHEQRMELLEEQEEEKTQALIEAYEQRREMLEDILDDEDATDEERKARMEQLEADHQDALTRIAARGNQERTAVAAQEARQRQTVMTDMMNNLTQLMNSGNKEMFQIGKVAAIANALLKGREAVVSAYAAGSKVGGPAVGAAFAATAAAATAAQIASVKSTSMGSGGSVTSGSSGGAVVTRPTDSISNDPRPVEQGPSDEPRHTRVTINMQGESYSRQQVRDLIEQINEATADGAQLRIA